MSRACVKSHHPLPPLITVLVPSDDHDTQAMYYHSSLYSSGHYSEVCESPHHLRALITIGVQVPTVQLKWAENLLVPAIMMYVKSSSPPTSHHCRSSGANSPHGDSYCDVCEQYSPPLTSHHSRSSGANSPHGESYHDVHEQYSPPPTSCHSRSSGANSPHGESYHDVHEQYSPPPTSCHSRSSGTNSPHGESHCDVHGQYSPPPTSCHSRSSGDDHGMYGYSRRYRTSSHDSPIDIRKSPS